MVKKITESEYEKIDKKGVIVIDFSAEWCGPCRMMEPVMEELSDEYEGRVPFYNVDVDANTNLASRFLVKGIPTISIVKDGMPEDTCVGVHPKEKIKEMIDTFL